MRLGRPKVPLILTDDVRVQLDSLTLVLVRRRTSRNARESSSRVPRDTITWWRTLVDVADDVRKFIDAHMRIPSPSSGRRPLTRFSRTSHGSLSRHSTSSPRHLFCEPGGQDTRHDRRNSPCATLSQDFRFGFLERQPYTPDPPARPDFLVAGRFQLPSMASSGPLRRRSRVSRNMSPTLARYAVSSSDGRGQPWPAILPAAAARPD
jgi:hypothetical protein